MFHILINKTHAPSSAAQRRFSNPKYMQMRWRPDPAGGAYSAPPDPLSGFGGRGEERGIKWLKEEGQGESRGGRGGKGKGREGEEMGIGLDPTKFRRKSTPLSTLQHADPTVVVSPCLQNIS